ncbi:MAG TPA: mechanosensitive ion channel [Candidatus Hydrogenedentes bacterium]|nr:mechanosensitive ion channel [Candidatus Hydrogenedentota bacterium]
MQTVRAGLCLVLLTAVTHLTTAQESSPSETMTASTLTSVEAQKAAVAQQQGMDEALRGRIVALYDEAITQLHLAEEWRAKGADSDRQREEAPVRIKEIQDTLAMPPEEPQPIPDSATLAEVEPLLAEAESAYRDAQAEFDRLMAEPRRRADRRREIPTLIGAAREHVQAIQAQLAEPAIQGDAPELAAARRTVAETTALAAAQEVTALEKELSSLDARASLLTIRQELAQRRLAQAEKRVKGLREAAATRRRDEAEIAAEEARRAIEEISGLDPAIRDRAVAVAVENAELAERRTGPKGLAEKIERAQADLEALKAQRAKLEDDHEAIVGRVRAAGLGYAVSLQLRDLKQQIPSSRDLRRRNRAISDAIAATEIEYSELTDQQLALVAIENDINEAIAELKDARTDYERERLRASIGSLIQDQRALLDALARDYQSYLNTLFETSMELAQLATQAATFTSYIDERIFWTRGTSAFRVSLFHEAIEAARALADPEMWARAVLLVQNELARNAAGYILVALPLAVYLLARRRLRLRLQLLGKKAANKREAHIGQTVQAAVLTLLIAAAWPLVLAVIGWRVTVVADPVDTVRAAGGGLLAVAVVVAVLAFFRHTLAHEGLAEAHFAFLARHATSVRRLIVLLTVVELPLVFVVFACEYQANEEWKESLGRIAFVAGMVLFAVFAARLLTLLHRAAVESKRGSWLEERTGVRRLLFLLIPGAPVALAVLTLSGYYYTAVQLATRLFQTYALVLIIVLITAGVRRWLLLARRRLAIEQARRRREAAKAEEEEGGETVPVEEVDIVRIDAQSQTLVRLAAGFAIFFGVWAIWLDIVPALAFFDQFRLWRSSVFVEESYTDASGEVATRVREEIVDTTVSDLGLAILIVVITVMAVRNLPGLLEMVFLKHLGPGERYALLAVVRYSLTALGFVLAFNAIGIGWSKVQWLVAALGLGLGFGLQEIFANFVSGLILLFERPIRVGDTVTLGGVSGTVTRIQIRATTIMDWDRKELVVPNKEFITGQLINWSLSDTVTRVVIPVGVAYGSDTRKVIETLLRVARTHADVIENPAPQALFLGFGHSALNFELRVFCDDIGARLGIFHDLHVAVDAAFREAGIEIAFPQHDLHIRSGLEALKGVIPSEPTPLAKIDEHDRGDAAHRPEH